MLILERLRLPPKEDTLIFSFIEDIMYDQLKLQIATLFVKITNNLVSLKTYGEAAAASQGAGKNSLMVVVTSTMAG